MSPGSKNPEKWASSQKLAVVVETFSLNEAELAEYGRQQDLYVEQTKTWRADVHRQRRPTPRALRPKRGR